MRRQLAILLTLILLAAALGTFLVPSLQASAAAVNPSTAYLVSWWPLNETSGIREDVVGTNDLTDNNTVTYNTGKKGNAASFNSTNSEYLSGTGPDLTSWSIVCWANVSSITNVRSVMEFSDSNSKRRGIRVVNNENVLVGTYGDNKTKFGNQVISTSTWYMLTGTFDSNLKLFVNTTEQTLGSETSATVPSASNLLTIGKNVASTGLYFNGLIDECSLWSTALTSDNIEWLYNSGNARTYDEVTEPTPTPTATATDTPTVTVTPSNTPSSTPTETLTPSPTATATATSTATETNTPSPTATHTASATATETETPTPTNTHDPLATHTFTPTQQYYLLNQVSYGDAASVAAMAGICLVIIIGLIVFVVLQIMSRRGK